MCLDNIIIRTDKTLRRVLTSASSQLLKINENKTKMIGMLSSLGFKRTWKTLPQSRHMIKLVSETGRSILYIFSLAKQYDNSFNFFSFPSEQWLVNHQNEKYLESRIWLQTDSSHTIRITSKLLPKSYTIFKISMSNLLDFAW